jgi:hypothetical protein
VKLYEKGPVAVLLNFAVQELPVALNNKVSVKIAIQDVEESYKVNFTILNPAVENVLFG